MSNERGFYVFFSVFTLFKMSESNEIRIRTVYNGCVMITYIPPTLTLDKFYNELRDLCQLNSEDKFTIKFIDEDGDPCVISSEEELDEALRLYEVNHDSELKLHVFPCIPPFPGMLCFGEDESVYRRGARRCRKYYKVNGHMLEAKRFNLKAYCALCAEWIWGLGRAGFKCINCKLLVRKKCHKMIKTSCVPPGTRKPDFSESNTPIIRKKSATNSQKRAGSKDSYFPGSGSLKGKQFSDQNSEDLQINLFSNQIGELTGDEVSVNIDKAAKALDSCESREYSLDDFDPLRVIGRGSYAKILMVELKATKRIYAMKIIKKQLMNDLGDIDWIHTEKRVFETASNYPFLVGLHSCYQTPSRLFFAIEFVRGGDLRLHMQRQRRLPKEHARFYSAEISLALNYLHKRGIIHRDLKLDNVLLDHDGHIKLTDYGMCKKGIRLGDSTSTFCGTRKYMAPEILRGLDYDFSVDWWALGVLLYEMLTGRSPFEIVGAAENSDLNTVDNLILNKTIRIPWWLSVKAQSILKGFLNKNPLERLGCHPQSGFTDITSHPFFKNIDFMLLESKQVSPPYKPKLNTDRDLDHFDPQVTCEPLLLTPDDMKEIEKIDQSEFEGFEYVNPLLMSMEDCV